MLDRIKSPSNFKQLFFSFFFFSERMQERYINRVAAYNYKRQNLFVCFGRKFRMRKFDTT